MIRNYFRHELKYFINYFDYINIKNKLLTCMERDENSNSDGNYHIRSLYFDDYQNSCLFEKQSGILTRKKYRIRIYNKSNHLIRFEKKSRVSNFIKKESTKISQDIYYDILNNKFNILPNENNNLLTQFYSDINSFLFRPKVIVDYFREAFIWQPNNVRVTFDKNLKSGMLATDIFSDFNTVSINEDNKLIMEIKYDNYLPHFIQNLLSFDSHERYAISKYVLCRKHNKHNNWEDN